MATTWRSHPLRWLSALDKRVGLNGSLVSKAVEHRITVSAFELDIDPSMLEPECGADLEPVYRQLFLAGDRCYDSMQERCCPLVNGGLGPPSSSGRPHQLRKQPTREQLQFASQAEQLIMPYLPPNHIGRALHQKSPVPHSGSTGMWSVSRCFDNNAINLWPYSRPSGTCQYCLLEQVTCCDKSGALVLHLDASMPAKQLNLHTPHVRRLHVPPTRLSQSCLLFRMDCEFATYSHCCAVRLKRKTHTFGRYCAGMPLWGRLCSISPSAGLPVTSLRIA
jgi:hypothetical protein